MMRSSIIAACLAAAGFAAACATGDLGPDMNIWDTTGGDTADVPGELPPDVPMDTFPPDIVDTFDPPPDGTDTPTDTAVEDGGGDPGTCTTADFVNQTMCSTGYKCTFMTYDGTTGEPVPVCDAAGDKGWNETCTVHPSTGHDDCQRGYLCVGTGTDSRCRLFCSSDTVCRSSPGGANAMCQITLVAGSVTITGVTLCSFHCDPLNAYSSGCDTSQACRGIGLTTGGWMTDCRDYGTGAGTACVGGTDDDCPRGEGCFTVGVDSMCLSYCSYPSGTPGCSYPDTCQAVTDWPTWIGVCYGG
jgi:hypothetical protein